MIRLDGDPWKQVYTMELCRCGRHPRFLRVAGLVASWKIGRAAMLVRR